MISLLSLAMAQTPTVPFTVLRPEWWGAVADDGQDDYPGFRAMVTVANALGKDVIVQLQPGEYQIDQYRRQDDPDSPDQLRFELIQGLSVEGNGATIRSFGAYNRRAGVKYPRKSPDNSISLLTFSRVTSLRVSDITVLGGVQDMTRDSGVAENGGNNGVSLSSVTGAVITDVESSYWAADGFYFGAGSKVAGVYTASKDIQMRRIKAWHNRRQGMSIIQAAGVLCEDCDLSYTGSDMPYGAHNPRAGVDIEPHRRECGHPALAEGDVCVDVITGGITFIRPVLKQNKGFCFVSEDTNKVDDVTIKDIFCEVDPTTNGGSGMLVSVRNGLVDGGHVDLARRKWYLTFKNDFKYFASDTVIRNVDITGSGFNLYYGPTAYLTKTVALENVDYTAKVDGAPWPSYLISIGEGPFSWTGGTITIPADGHDLKSYDYIARLRGDWTDVTFSTDLDPDSGLWYSLSAGAASLCRVSMAGPPGGVNVGTKLRKAPVLYSDGCAP